MGRAGTEKAGFEWMTDSNTLMFLELKAAQPPEMTSPSTRGSH